MDQNLITPERFDELYQESERKNQGIIDVLVSEKVVERNYLSDLIASLLGVPRADFSLQPWTKWSWSSFPPTSPGNARSLFLKRKMTGRMTSR